MVGSSFWLVWLGVMLELLVMRCILGFCGYRFSLAILVRLCHNSLCGSRISCAVIYKLILMSYMFVRGCFFVVLVVGVYFVWRVYNTLKPIFVAWEFR